MKVQEVFNLENLRLKRVQFKDLGVGDKFILYSQDDYPDPTPDNPEGHFFGKLSDNLSSAHNLFFMRLSDGWEFEGSVEKVVASDGRPNYFPDGMLVSKIVAAEET